MSTKQVAVSLDSRGLNIAIFMFILVFMIGYALGATRVMRLIDSGQVVVCEPEEKLKGK